ncbi:MAG TPA: hypothetical protein VL286_01315 [Rhizomicrobium sp.]|jgi:hypothetical protein|nr:hypothetical protein [Rhizomicrobium sp.]
MATTRVISTTVTFARPFILDGFEELQPPGSYVVDTEQELIDSPSVTAWKRISTAIQLHRHGGTEYVPINPDQLSEALRRDGAQHDPTAPVSSTSAKGRHDRARRILSLLPLQKAR